jgi:hypothetical protein|nr:MAG TPA: Mycobacterial 2 TMS Phage Holin (M2 Hol) Family [Caudoviricetes sp.]
MSDTPKHAANATPQPISWLTPTVRRWAYGVILAAVALLVAYGRIEAQVAPLWVALAAAVLGNVTAIAHVPQGGQ